MLYRRIDSLVRASQVLRVERAKRSRDRGSNPNDALFQVWPKNRNPKVAAKKSCGCRTAEGLLERAAQ